MPRKESLRVPGRQTMPARVLALRRLDELVLRLKADAAARQVQGHDELAQDPGADCSQAPAVVADEDGRRGAFHAVAADMQVSLQGRPLELAPLMGGEAGSLRGGGGDPKRLGGAAGEVQGAA